jgi:hypothetical protein
MREPVTYGVVVFACVAFVGWITGMGGSLALNFGFAALMGVFAGGLYAAVKRMARRNTNGE